MEGSGKKKIAKSVKRLTMDVNSQIGRVSRHHEEVSGTMFAIGTQVIASRTSWTTPQAHMKPSDHKQMRRSLGLGNIRRYCKRKETFTTFRPVL